MQKIQETSSREKERSIFLVTWKMCKKWHKPQEQQRIKIRIILRIEEWEGMERGRMKINEEGTVKHYILFGLRIWS